MADLKKTIIIKKNSCIKFILIDELKSSAGFTQALENLKSDLSATLGCTSCDGTFDLEISFEISDKLPAECYSIKLSDKKVSVAGGDVFALMWAIYDICEKTLGVSPFRSFLEMSYKKLEYAEICEVDLSEKPVYKYRGWFFNDEDYLTGWRPVAGKRPVDYLFYGNIMNHQTVDELADTILRNKLNLMIPSSFLDIDMPEDEENIRRITEKGLYVSQHHIEPLGVSRFAFAAYFERKGIKDQDASYVTASDAYDEVWRHYVRKWAKYKNVIWQLGLRGKVDRPVWLDDPSIKNDKEFGGKIISEAIAHQLRIIKEECGCENPIVTMTLWEEGSELYHKGYLKIPDEVMIVFADWPRTQLMRPDFNFIEREEDRQYGIYHHTGSFCAGPHAVQGSKLDLMRNLFRIAEEKGDTDYFISNVQCLREVVYGAYAMSKFAFYGSDISEKELSLDWCRTILGDRAKELDEIYNLFYDTFPVNQWDEYTLEGITYWFDGFVRLAGLYPIDLHMKNIFDEEMKPERAAAYIVEMDDSYKRWVATGEKIAEFMQSLDGEVKTFVNDNLYLQAKTMEILSLWAYYINVAIMLDRGGKADEAVINAEKSIEVLERIFDVLPLAEHGKFVDWYNNEDKFDYKRMIGTTKELIEFFNTPCDKRTYWPRTKNTYILNYKFG